MATEEKSKKCSPLVAVLVGVVIALITVISALLIIRSLGGETKKKRNVCETPECIDLAHRLHNFADTSVDPCVDFFKFSCGKYHEYIHLPITSLDEKTLSISKTLSAFLRKKEKSNLHSENLLKMAHQACEKSSKTDNLKDILANIAKIGKWPLLHSNWTDDSFELNDWLFNIANLATHRFGLFEIYTLSLFGIFPQTGRLLDPNELKPYIEQLLNVSNVQMNKDVRNQIAYDVGQVHALAKKIETLCPDIGGKTTYSKLKKAVPSIDFDRLLGTLASSLSVDELAEKAVVIFSLDKMRIDTPPRVLANVLISRYIITSFRELPEDGNCGQWVAKHFLEPSLKVFASNYFDHENIQLVSDMVDELKTSYVQMFKESEWLSESTRKTALAKVDKMTKSVGYPDGWDKDLEKNYEKLDIKPTDSILTIQSKAAKFRTEQNIAYGIDESLFVPGDQHADVNAYYVPMRNHLSINTAIMDDPMFDATFPMYARLAGNGQILGHEIGHAFDSVGATFDENGEFKNWWTRREKKTFQEEGQCFVKQYENYDDPEFGKTLNGTLTLGEMMADQLGTEAIWMAYKRLHTSDEPDFAGFEGYSIDKLFFRIKAMTYCRNPTTYTLAEQMKDVHPTDSFRVNGVVSNMKQFAKAFNCPAGSPMNPEKKCTIF